MRSERKRKRSFLARFMVLFMIINLLSGVNPSVVRAEENVYFKNGDEKQENGITISKNIVKYDNKTGVYDIELKVKGSSEKIQETKPLDVVLVMDTSKNMEKVIANAKEAARNVVDKLITNNTAKNVKMSIVSFADKGKKEIALTDNVNALKSVIAKLNAAGGAFTQHGIEVASDILNNAPADHKKVMILVSNGEPNIANGIHPDFGEKEKKFKRIFDPSEKSDGYEQWYGNIYYWHGKGYNKDERNYLVWLRNGLFGNGTKETQGKGHISWPYELMDEYFNNATIKAAEKIKQNTEIITVGIGIKDNRLAKLIMNNLATNGKYLETNSTGSELDKLLDSIAEKFKNKVYEGVITDPMSEYVDYVEGTASLEGSKKDAVLVFENNKLKVTNVVLGDKEELTLKYKVKLKDNWKDGEFHPANGETTLTPTPNAKPMNFNVPEVRADEEKVTLTVNKKWIGEAPVASVTFNIKADNGTPNYTVEVRADNNGNWTGKLDNLPRYNDGEDIQYTVEEARGDNYELKGKIGSVADNNGNITFAATNQNTEKVDITVTKKWVNTPDEYKGDIKVAIYSRAEGETDFKKGAIQTLSKSYENKKMTLFANLLKYNEDGKLIEYKVEEEGTDKEGKLKIGDNSFKVVVEQSKNDNYDWTITNTCDPINEMIKFTLVKEWDTVPDESVKPMFTIKATAGKYSSSSSITLPIKEKEGYYNTEKSVDGKTWTTKIQALKYYKNNTPITYTIEEEKLNGYESTPNGPQKIEDKGTVTFTNNRTMKKLILEKKWVGNPGNQAEFTLSGNNSNDVITLNNSNNWEAEKDLPVYSLDGKVIEYTIKETKIEGYDAYSDSKQFTLVDGDNKPADKSVIFTNTKMLDPKKPFTVRKTWNGKPAERVSFGLFADNENEPKEIITLESKDFLIPSYDQKVWTGKFKKALPEYKLDKDGNPVKIDYVVKELENNQPVEKEVILGNRTYKVESRPAGNNVFNFTNTDITKGDVQIIKTWVGTEGKAKFGLFKNGDEKIPNIKPDVTKTSVDGQYTVKFENVSLTDEDGNAVKYEIKELGDNDTILETNDTVSLEGRKYKVSYDSSGNITNTELIDITVNKTWADNVPQSERKSVEVGIYAGNERKSTVELKGGKWKDTVANLPYLPDGYTVKEVEINGIEVNNDLKKLYKVEGEMEKIKETSTINITNSFDLSENKEGKINVLKLWTVDSKNIKVKLYRKTAATTTESSKWVEAGTEELNGDTKVLKTAFDKVEGSEKYQILETAVGTDELTEDDIQNILSSKTESPIEYKIGEYEVTVHNLGNDTFFIKNTQDSTMKELVVEKKWSDNTLDKYKEAVQVQLYKVENNNLVPVGESRYLNSSNWKTKFKGLRIKDAEGKNIDYRVAEVVVGNTIKTNLTLEDLQKSYKIGSSTVTIDGNNANTVVITNDVNLRDISVKKAWEGTATAGAVEITLYKKVGDNLESVETKQLNSEGKWMADFERQPKVDKEGVEIKYQIFETAIDGAKINIDPTKATGYKADEHENISYSTGTINDGSYSVVITGNSKDNNFVVKNSFTRNPVLPVIPGGNTPVVPVNPPVDPTPNPTPNPSTPVVDVPDDSTPQGPSSPGNNSGEDGNTNGDEDDGDNGFEEIDEDEVPQDGNIDNTDDADDADDNNEEETTDIADNKAPKGTPKLPKTGGETGDFLSIIGLGLIGLGLVIRRRR